MTDHPQQIPAQRVPPSVWRNPWHFLAFGFGSGTMPKAPGTWGSLVGVALAWIVVALGGPVPLVAIAIVLFTLGWWAADRVARAITSL